MLRLEEMPPWRVWLGLVWIPDKILRGPTDSVGFWMLSGRFSRASSLLSSPSTGVRVPARGMEIVGSFLYDVAGMLVTLNGRGCKEQTSLASTPAERNNAQNNWAPLSRDASRFLAAAQKSLFCSGSSRSSGKCI